jgi:hypothetical protein
MEKNQWDMYDEWGHKIPYLKVPEGVMVKALPPFGGAVIRYSFSLDGSDDNCVSVYLDVDNSLGFSRNGDPYWEIYPNEDYDTARFLLGEEEEMMGEILISLITRS